MTDVSARPGSRTPRGGPGARTASRHSGSVSSTTARRPPAGRQPTRETVETVRAGARPGAAAPRGRGATSPPIVVPRPPRPGRAGRRARLVVLAVAVVLVVAVFAGRLVYVQAVRGPSVAQQARDERLSTISIIGARGQITDRDGVALATSVERYDISVNQRLVGEYRGKGAPDDPDGALGVAKRLAPLLGADAAVLGGELVGTRSFKYLQKGVLPQVAREIFAMRLPGINVDKVADRVYPNGPLAGNIIGFVNSNGQGLEGLEASLDDRLKGTPGTEVFERGAKGQQVPGGYFEGTPATQGDSATLTIDSDIQWKAESLLNEQVAATGSDSGTIVVMDVRTGEVLALADSGSRDPNKPGDSAGGSLAPSVSNVFEPGSTGKVITMAAVLEEGLVTPTDRWTVPYKLTVENGQTFKDSHEHETQHLTTAGVLAESSNTGTVQIGSKLTVDQRYRWLERFGFGSRTGIDLAGESAGLFGDRNNARTPYVVLFGQGVSVNAIQATQVLATVANDGVRVQPHVVRGWTAPDGTFTASKKAARTRIISQETAATVMTMLESVVDEGTGSTASIPGYRVAGKTGTAQNWINGGKQGITASFIGVVPADEPRLAISVILHNPRTSEYGSVVAAPVFSKIGAYALSELGVPPSGTKATLFPTTW